MTDLLAAPIPDRSGSPNLDPAIVLVAHRGPLRFSQVNGERAVRRNMGGLVTALESLVQQVDTSVRWICAPSSETDRAIARRGDWTQFVSESDSTTGRSHGAGSPAACDVRMLDVDRDAHAAFYNVIANPLLWFVQHDLYDGVAPDFGERERSAWSNGYVAVNRTFAAALADPEIVPRDSTVMVHDYHFYLVPEMLRAARPDVFIHHFTHIPWPRPDAWRLLPTAVTRAIFTGLLGSDLIGFHTAADVRNFVLGCNEFLGLPVEIDGCSVAVDGRRVSVRHYPISINADALEQSARTTKVAARSRELAVTRPERLIVRVDRADPSKNIVRGFAAYAHTLRTHPELHGRVTFLALLQPTRGEVAEYAQYRRDIEDIVDDINAEFSNPIHDENGTWLPVDLRFVEDLALALAAYKCFDVLLVNSLADGMNLVVKEALVVNENDGAVVLSERAGAHDELGAVVISVDPFDVEQQGDALYEALALPAAIRRDRLAMGAEIVRANDMQKWLRHQLNDIEIARLYERTSRATGSA